jgi:hypothetical protein
MTEDNNNNNNDDREGLLVDIPWSIRRKRKELSTDLEHYLGLLSFNQLIMEANDVILQLRLDEEADDDLIIKAKFLLNELNYRVGIDSPKSKII